MTMRAVTFGLWIGIMGAILASGPQAMAQVRQDLWVPNGTVAATAILGNTVYLGGNFTQVGLATGGAAPIDPVTGQLIRPFAQVGGRVSAIAPDGTGGWVLAGDFTHVQGSPRNGLAHVDATGNVTPWAPPSLNGEIRSLIVASGKVFVGGFFSVMDPLTVTLYEHACAFDLSTGGFAAWNPIVNAEIRTIVLGGSGQIYLDGYFTTVNGIPRNGLAAVDPNTAACLPWTSPVPGRPVAVAGGNVFISLGDLSAVDESTGQLNFSVSVSGGVASAAFDAASSILYLGGTFSDVSGAVRQNLAAIDLSGFVTPWAPVATNGDVYAVAVNGTNVYVGGTFSTLAGQPRAFLGAVNKQTGAAAAWNPGVDRRVDCLAAGNGLVYAGGIFSMMNWVPRSNVAAFDISSGSILPWDPSPNGEIYCLAAGSNTIYMGGMFTTVGGLTRRHLAAVDATTGTPTAFTANTNPGDQNTIFALVLRGSTLYAGGSFQILNGVSKRFLAALDATTGAILPFEANVNSSVHTMQIFTPTDIFLPIVLYIGGQFTSAGFQTVTGLACIDVASGASTGWAPQLSGGPLWVEQLAIVASVNQVQTVYIAGSFTSISGLPRAGLAAVNGGGVGVVQDWDPAPNGSVQAISPAGNRVYLGGSFTSLGGQARKYLGAVDSNSGAPTAWNPQVDHDIFFCCAYRVSTILRWRSTIYVGGFFHSAQGWPRNNFAGFLDGTVTDVAEGAPPRVPSALRASPNPFASSTVATFAIPSAEDAEVAVYDIAGRRVRVLHRGILGAGTHRMPWDGLDEHGRRLPSGVYFASVRSANLDLAAKVHLLQ